MRELEDRHLRRRTRRRDSTANRERLVGIRQRQGIVVGDRAQRAGDTALGSVVRGPEVATMARRLRLRHRQPVSSPATKPVRVTATTYRACKSRQLGSS
jgi:hypothetical protein